MIIVKSKTSTYKRRYINTNKSDIVAGYIVRELSKNGLLSWNRNEPL
ncbi:hypothetical protein VCRA2119O147_3320002 [Vibrio crassostreae]|nr:hypothetical protein VCRA2119O147_3320002 [Vibrio crassostreae]